MIGRRQFLVMGAVGAAAGVAAACSKSQSPPAAPTSTDVSLAAGETDIDLGGVKVHTWAYGNQVPAREIRLKKGERLRAELTNAMPQDVTVHWHGIAIVNDMDGVPDLTQAAVPNGQKFTYDFVVPDAGTYWFHSHVGTQLDRGLYGPLIIEDPTEKVGLRRRVRGRARRLDRRHRHQPGPGLRKPAQDRHEADGARRPRRDARRARSARTAATSPTPTSSSTAGFPPIRRWWITVRANGFGYASSMPDRTPRSGWRYPNTTMKVIQTDGYPVVPMQANSVILGMGERVDAIVTVNESLPVVAVPEGKQGHAQLNMRVNNAPSAVNVDDFVASVRKEAPLDTATLSPTPEVTLSAKAPDQVIDARLTGPVNGYTWPVNGKLYNPPNDGVPVKPNQRVRIRFINESMMFHPFHLHGHTFQVMTATRGARTTRRQGPQGYGAGAAQADRRGRLRHEQSRSVDQPLPQHLPPRGGDGVLRGVRRLVSRTT